MRCPSCGLELDQPTPAQCPRCGRALEAPPDPSVSAAYEPYGQSGQYPPQDGYGQSPYSQPAPPNYPVTSGYPPPGHPQTPYAPPQRKRRTGLIVGIVVAVVVLAACTGGTIFAIHALRQAGAAASARTSVAIPTISGSKVYSNTFASNADVDGWLNDPGHCYLGNDGYHAADDYFCLAPIAEQDNIDMTVNVRLVSGSTAASYGIVFRLQDKTDFYAFMITSSGYWSLIRCVNADCTTPVYFTADSAIKTGLNTANTIEVRATGPHFVFSVNGAKVGSFDDTTFSFGKVGFIAAGGPAALLDCAFTDLVITRPD